jgi:hypothetical protein
MNHTAEMDHTAEMTNADLKQHLYVKFAQSSNIDDLNEYVKVCKQIFGDAVDIYVQILLNSFDTKTILTESGKTILINYLGFCEYPDPDTPDCCPMCREQSVYRYRLTK